MFSDLFLDQLNPGGCVIPWRTVHTYVVDCDYD